jgi:class 3 adenylate cyclase
MSTIENVKAHELASLAVEKGVLKRLRMICYILAMAHVSFSLTSLNFLHRFDPTISFFDNLVPRMILNAAPFFLFGKYFLARENVSGPVRIISYIWVYAFLFFVAAWIYVWPIALKGNPEVFLYVAGVNTAYLCSTWSVAAIPSRFLNHIVLSLGLLIVVPVMMIAYLSGDSHIMQIVTADLIFAMAVGVGLGILGSNVFWQLEYLRAENEVEASKYLGEPLRKAIYEKRDDILQETICSAYIMMLDIRDSTNLTRKHGSAWSEFNKEWLGFANDLIKSHGGTFVKSTGDGLLAAFGLFDEEGAVRDIPGMEEANRIADEERWIGLTVNSYGCIEIIFRRFEELSARYFPNEVIRLACGLDRGPVHRGVRGGKDRQEFDIWGDKVNTAAKLEAFSKVVSHNFDPESSLLVISPYAADFLDDLDGFTKMEMSESIRGSLYGIRWVLVREYKSRRTADKSAA